MLSIFVYLHVYALPTQGCARAQGAAGHGQQVRKSRLSMLFCLLTSPAPTQKLFAYLPTHLSSGVYAALSDNVQRGEYYRNNLKYQVVGPAGDPKHGPPLWELSAKCVQDKVGADVPNAQAMERK